MRIQKLKEWHTPKHTDCQTWLDEERLKCEDLKFKKDFTVTIQLMDLSGIQMAKVCPLGKLSVNQAVLNVY